MPSVPEKQTKTDLDGDGVIGEAVEKALEVEVKPEVHEDAAADTAEVVEEPEVEEPTPAAEAPVEPEVVETEGEEAPAEEASAE